MGRRGHSRAALPVPQDADTSREKIAEIKRSLSSLEHLSSGTLLKRMKVCGNLRCHCASDPAARHGPYYEWSYLKDVTARSHPSRPTSCGWRSPITARRRNYCGLGRRSRRTVPQPGRSREPCCNAAPPAHQRSVPGTVGCRQLFVLTCAVVPDGDFPPVRSRT